MLKDSLPSVVVSAAREWEMEQDPDLLVVQEPVSEPAETSALLILLPESE